MTRNATLAAALDEAKEAYAAANPASLALHQRARGTMPGGNAQCALFRPVPAGVRAG
jgi:hypothetical protein